ncbi:hypothetical protein AXG93_625s1280 [Marchantia polymorpha subsp. ruderalis]|uniref:CCHC-type domain-containing protein n=1 Tax=Marchantia polymorpha subsp. ruderalis TaxID=1480154 RepID=A0A176VCA0_MARPO|nr:hypothetical protein AXG93_625s1280 [Marchantia polymorpha subsp. ruderalis]
MVPVGDLVITEEFDGSFEDRGGFTRSELRYRLPHPSAAVVEEAQGVANSGSLMVISSSVSHSLTGDMDRIYGAMKGPRRYYGGVGRSGGASSSIIEGTSGAATSGGAVSIASSSMSGEATGVPLFNPIPEFFKRLREELSGAEDGEAEESLGAVQYWYRIQDRELQRRVQDATLLSDASPTLACVFALSEKVELNIVEERVVTFSFARDMTTTTCVPHNTAQSRPFGGGSGGGRGAHTRHQTAARDTGASALLPSFAGQQQGPACWTCGVDHLRRDCPQEAGVRSSQARPKDRDGDVFRGRDGRAGRGGRGAGVVGRTAASATLATESGMTARIEQLEQRLATMASSGASTSTSYEEEDFSYLASAALVEASVAVTRGIARA